MAAEQLWLSPAYHRASATIHCTWVPDWPAVRAVLPAVEAALGPFRPRPRWAKLYLLEPTRVREPYERFPAFAASVRRLDPGGLFRNDDLDRFLG